MRLLRDYESRNVTFIEPDSSWPIVWQRAQGVHVWDSEGKKYLDLTAAFGVAAAGHGNAAVTTAGAAQMKQLLHAMGDVHPHQLKGELARSLSALTFERWLKTGAERGTTGKVIFCNSGFEAVEAALKTAFLATGKEEVIAFRGAYHGLGYGALNVTEREHFRSPFRKQLSEFATFAPYPLQQQDMKTTETTLRQLMATKKFGALLVEPIQGRSGIHVPPAGFLTLLRRLCTTFGVVLIFDEILTGFGRTGKWFACEHDRAVPDMVCLGKALTGGFPLSACVGRKSLMDAAWPPSAGEAIHTSTFLGHPVGCAMALAQIREISERKLVERSRVRGEFLQKELRTQLWKHHLTSFQITIRGQGLLAGVELRHANGSPATDESLQAIKTLLRQGFIFLPEGEHANVISFMPPLTISERQLKTAVAALVRSLAER